MMNVNPRYLMSISECLSFLTSKREFREFRARWGRVVHNEGDVCVKGEFFLVSSLEVRVAGNFAFLNI